MITIVTDEPAYEPNETFSWCLSNPTNATIADGTGVAHHPQRRLQRWAADRHLPDCGRGRRRCNQDGTSARRRRRPDVGRHRIVGGLELRRAPLHRRDASAQRHHHLGPTRGQRRQYRWITLGFEFGIEAAASSAAFSAASLPSARTLLAPRVLHSVEPAVDGQQLDRARRPLDGPPGAGEPGRLESRAMRSA